MQPLFLGLLTILSTLFVCSPAQGQTNPVEEKTSDSPSNADHDINFDTLPRETFVPFTRQGNLLLVMGSINGKRTPMIFDTGAGGCLFSIQTLTSLGIKIPTDLQSVSVAGIGSKQQTQAWKMSVDLKLGSIERRNFTVHINDNPLNLPLLGVDFVRGYEYTINADSNIIQFKLISKKLAQTPPPAPSPPQTKSKIVIFKADQNTLHSARLKNALARPKAETSNPLSSDALANLTSKSYITVDSQCRYVYSVPFTEYRGAIIVMVEIEGRKCPMILDTGTNLCLFSSTHLKELGISPHSTGQLLNAKGAAGFIKAPLCVFDHAQFGPIKDRLVCLVSDEGFIPRPLLGQNFFGKWELTVDHVHHLIKFNHK